jgi:hypothetical protein
MSLTSLVEQIRHQMERGQFQNEAAISQGVILPVLNGLGWPVFNTSVVIPEYLIEGRRVDYALCAYQDRPAIFVEVKAIGKADGADRQLFEYAFHKGVPLAILTDGREWHFFLPAEEGEYQERRVYKLDIIEREPTDVTRYFERYLKYDRVCSGQALEAARSDYQDVSRRRKIMETLPRAWARLIEERDEILLELLAEKVEDLCGYRPELEVCSQYISIIATRPGTDAPLKPTRPIVQKTSVPPRQRAPVQVGAVLSGVFTLAQLAQKSLSSSRPSGINIGGTDISTRNWSDLCIKLVQWLLNHGYLSRSHVPVYNAAGRNKYFINAKPEHEDPSKDGLWKSVGDLYVDVKYNAKHHVKNIIYLLEHIEAGDLDIRITL